MDSCIGLGVIFGEFVEAFVLSLNVLLIRLNILLTGGNVCGIGSTLLLVGGNPSFIACNALFVGGNVGLVNRLLLLHRIQASLNSFSQDEIIVREFDGLSGDLGVGASSFHLNFQPWY
jgi:hypothetical protein